MRKLDVKIEMGEKLKNKYVIGIDMNKNSINFCQGKICY